MERFTKYPNIFKQHENCLHNRGGYINMFWHVVLPQVRMYIYNLTREFTLHT